MQPFIMDHPLIQHKITLLRNKNTGTKQFRELVEEIGKSIAYLGNEKCLAGGDIIVLKHSQDPMFMGFALDSKYVQGQKSFGKTKKCR